MEITSVQLVGLIITVTGALKLALHAIDKLVSLIWKNGRGPATSEKDWRVMADKVEKLENQEAASHVRLDHLEAAVKDLHNCIDKFQEKNETAHEKTDLRLDGIQAVLYRLDGRFDLMEKFIKRGK